MKEHNRTYLVIGAGGTGAPIGAFLAKAGLPVHLIARGAHLAAIREHGLCFDTSYMGSYNVPVSASDMPAYEASGEHPDVIFVCVKYGGLADTIPFIRKVAKADTVVIPILNVYGTGRKLQEALPELLVTDGCIYVSCNITAPGHLMMHGPIFRIVYGVPGKPADDERLLAVADDLKKAGIVPEYSAEIEKDALKKFSYVSAMATCGLYYHALAGDMQKPGEIRTLFCTLCGEIEQLAAAMGIRYEEPLTAVNLKILDDLAPSASTSMQRDIYARKSSEIDGLIYEVVRLADLYLLELPAYRKAAAKFKEEGI